MHPTQSSTDNPLVQVRSACKTVAERAALVHIDCDRLPAYAAALPLDEIRQPELHASRHYLGHGEDTAAFFVTLDAINFGSGYFPHVRKRPGMSGYFTVASSLNDYFQAHGPLSAEQLAQFTAEDGARMFGQDLANAPVAELMGLLPSAGRPGTLPAKPVRRPLCPPDRSGRPVGRAARGATAGHAAV